MLLCYKCEKEENSGNLICEACLRAIHKQIDRGLTEIDTKHPPSEVKMGYVYAWPEEK